jgi:tetratricopeptide (TPR) repeat protein
LDKAVEAMQRASSAEPPAPPWTVAWLSGLVNRQQGRLAEAERNFRSVLEDRTPAMVERGFDFSLDYDVVNLLGETLFDRAKMLDRDPSQQAEREALLRDAIAQFEKTLRLDTENVSAHYNLGLLYKALGDEAKSAEHAALHDKYKPDDNARDEAIAKARKRYPAADRAAEKVVIYSLHRPGAPGLPQSAAAARVDGGHDAARTTGGGR